MQKKQITMTILMMTKKQKGKMREIKSKKTLTKKKNNKTTWKKKRCLMLLNTVSLELLRL